jgi:hypothetical protein
MPDQFLPGELPPNDDPHPDAPPFQTVMNVVMALALRKGGRLVVAPHEYEGSKVGVSIVVEDDGRIIVEVMAMSDGEVKAH